MCRWSLMCSTRREQQPTVSAVSSSFSLPALRASYTHPHRGTSITTPYDNLYVSTVVYTTTQYSCKNLLPLSIKICVGRSDHKPRALNTNVHGQGTHLLTCQGGLGHIWTHESPIRVQQGNITLLQNVHTVLVTEQQLWEIENCMMQVAVILT